MRNTMKKLLCMALAIMLLVSAVPVFAAAADPAFTVNVTVKDTSDAILTTDDVARNTPITAERCLEKVMSTWADDYTVEKVWIKNDETGSDGLTTDLGHEISRDTRLVVKLAHKPVTLYVDFMKGETKIERKSKQVPYGSTIVLNDALAAEFGYGGVDTRVTCGGLQEGESFVITKDKIVTVNIVTSTGSTPAPDNGGSTPAPDNGGSTPAPDNGGSTPAPDNGGSTPAPDNSGSSTTKMINVTIKVGVDTVINGREIDKAEATVNELIKIFNSDWTEDYTFNKAVIEGETKTSTREVVKAGEAVVIYLSKTEKDPLHDKLSDLKPVVLHVYLNNNFDSEHKSYTITEIAKDGTLDLNGDVKDFLKERYTAKTSDGITYDGMYVADGYFGEKYLSDDKRVVIGNDADATGNTTLDYMRSKGYVHLNVMLTNAQSKSTSSATADSSNPKTGDTIFVPFMVMSAASVALAAAYVYGKKHFAR